MSSPPTFVSMKLVYTLSSIVNDTFRAAAQFPIKMLWCEIQHQQWIKTPKVPEAPPFEKTL